MLLLNYFPRRVAARLVPVSSEESELAGHGAPLSIKERKRRRNAAQFSLNTLPSGGTCARRDFGPHAPCFRQVAPRVARTQPTLPVVSWCSSVQAAAEAGGVRGHGC